MSIIYAGQKQGSPHSLTFSLSEELQNLQFRHNEVTLNISSSGNPAVQCLDRKHVNIQPSTNRMQHNELLPIASRKG